jgi:hypothetical protein
VHLFHEEVLLVFLLLGGEVALLKRVGRAANADVGVHPLHDSLVEGGEGTMLCLAGPLEEGLGVAVVEAAPVRDGAALGGEPHQLLAQRPGVVADEIDIEELAGAELEAVVDEVRGKLGDAGVGSHGGGLLHG